MNISPVFLFSGVTLFCWGIETALFKKYSQLSFGPKLIFYRNTVTATIALFTLLLFINKAVFDLKYILFGILLATAGYLGLYFYLKAFRVGKAGIISPIGNTRLLVAVLVAVLFLGDTINNIQAISIFIVFTGVVLATINFRSFKTSSLFDPKSGVSFVILTALIWGIVHPFYSIPAIALSAFLFTFILEATVALLGGLQTILSKEKLLDINLVKMLPSILTIGVLGGVGSVFLNLAYATGEISIASTVISMIPLIVIVYGVLVYKERLTLKEVVSAILMIIGVLLLAYFDS